MKVTPFVVTYSGMATGPSIKRCVEYLMMEAPATFGSAIEQVDIYAHCQSVEPIIDSLIGMHERFQTRLATLPFLKFNRRARLFEVSYVSQLSHSSSMFGSAETPLSSTEFNCLCREFAGALSLARRRLTRSDVFNIEALDRHLQRRVASLDEDA